jgi:hypothetical protein
MIRWGYLLPGVGIWAALILHAMLFYMLDKVLGKVLVRSYLNKIFWVVMLIGGYAAASLVSIGLGFSPVP